MQAQAASPTRSAQSARPLSLEPEDRRLGEFDSTRNVEVPAYFDWPSRLHAVAAAGGASAEFVPPDHETVRPEIIEAGNRVMAIHAEVLRRLAE